MIRTLERKLQEMRKEAKRSLVRGAEYIMTISKVQYVPVRDGILRSTGHVTPAEGDALLVTLAYGGPSAPYAVIQHEKVFNHRIGEDHYLEKPFRLLAPKIMEDIARDIKQ